MNKPPEEIEINPEAKNDKSEKDEVEKLENELKSDDQNVKNEIKDSKDDH